MISHTKYAKRRLNDSTAYGYEGYTYSMWDNHTAVLDPVTKAVVGRPGAVALLRRFHKVKLLERILAQRGVLSRGR